MANSLPFNAILVDEKYDRVYKAEDWAWYFATFIANGVFPKPSDGLQVIAYDKMEVKVNAGYAFINGYAFRNPVSKSIVLNTAEGALNRIDRVIIRWDLTIRDIYITVLKGIPSAKPTAAALTRNTEIWELAIADIYVAKGVTRIQTKDITDRRFNSALCGIVKGTIEEIDASVLTKQFDDFFATYSRKTLEEYSKFVQSAQEAYANFTQMMQDDYDSFNADIMAHLSRLKKNSTDAYNSLIDLMNNCYNDLSGLGRDLYDRYREEIEGYMSRLEAKGNADLAGITQELSDFKNTNEAEFLAWFEHIKGLLGSDIGGNLLNGLDGLAGRVEDVEEMLFTGIVRAKLITDGGDYITDHLGNPILTGWPICKCNK